MAESDANENTEKAEQTKGLFDEIEEHRPGLLSRIYHSKATTIGCGAVLLLGLTAYLASPHISKIYKKKPSEQKQAGLSNNKNKQSHSGNNDSSKNKAPKEKELEERIRVICPDGSTIEFYTPTPNKVDISSKLCYYAAESDQKPTAAAAKADGAIKIPAATGSIDSIGNADLACVDKKGYDQKIKLTKPKPPEIRYTTINNRVVQLVNGTQNDIGTIRDDLYEGRMLSNSLKFSPDQNYIAWVVDLGGRESKGRNWNTHMALYSAKVVKTPEGIDIAEESVKNLGEFQNAYEKWRVDIPVPFSWLTDNEIAVSTSRIVGDGKKSRIQKNIKSIGVAWLY